MGAETFIESANGATAREAFQNARQSALYDFGHSGYTGTIAEKDRFVLIKLPEGREAYGYANELINQGDARVDDKWGPAGAIHLGDDEYLFFGWASS